jgi:hypothetical protein
VVLALPAIFGLLVGLALGGSPARLASLELRHPWLVLWAIGLQVLAFPFTWLPWDTHQTVAIALWLVSFSLLAVAGWLNRAIAGIRMIVLGMALNVAAVVANGGMMPALPSALRAAGTEYSVSNNSFAADDPNLAALVDRWALPTWMPGNVFSAGDVVIAIGVVVLVVAAMEPRWRRSAATI